MKADIEKIKALMEARLVNVQRHPEADLFIYNYTPEAQFARAWTPELLMCRGLITDASGNIVARPFPKFFNLEEHEGDLPAEDFTVTEKMDGSLGILYWLGDVPHIATRGSFTSDQALRGTEILRRLNLSPKIFAPGVTYLFEIIYPENRIVVDYGPHERLVFLTAIDNETGLDVPVPFPTEAAKVYSGVSDVRALRAHARDNAEGYVIRFRSGLRLKVKFEEYVRLHRIVTGTNSRVVWEALAVEMLKKKGLDAKTIGERICLDPLHVTELLAYDGDLMGRLLERVPDEFYKWVKETAEDFQDKFGAVYAHAKGAIVLNRLREIPRKEAAEIVLGHYREISSTVFSMLDNGEWASSIWKQIYPKLSRPFMDKKGVE